MRPWPLLLALTLASVPVAALAGGLASGPVCANVKDPSQLPLPEAGLAAAAAAGLELEHLAVPLKQPLPEGGFEALLAPGEETHACTGLIRPGAPIIINDAWLCTLNWVYTDPAGALYVGTAGHCVEDTRPALIEVPGVPGDIGDAVFSTGNGGVGNDFAIIRILPSHYRWVTPVLCHYGGPDHVATVGGFPPQGGDAAGQSVVLHYGWGNIYQMTSATRARAGVLSSLGWAQRSILFQGISAPGDSGSGFETLFGGAAGVITHGIHVPVANVGMGLVYGTRVDYGLGQARAATGIPFTLVQGGFVDPTGLGTA